MRVEELRAASGQSRQPDACAPSRASASDSHSHASASDSPGRASASDNPIGTGGSDWSRRREASVPRGIATAFPIFVERAENAEVWDREGRRYIDFAGGIGALNVGHRHPKVVAAAKEQLDKLMHSAFQVLAYSSYIQLAEQLNDRAPIRGACKTILFSTGAEALENAIKIARLATGRRAVVSFSGAFHGRSLLALALTGKVLPYKREFGPLPAEVFHAPFPVELHGVSIENSLQGLEHIFRTEIEPEQVAAILFEPVQGEGGFYIAPEEWILRLRQICDQHGILLIADEVQTGFARTGKFFAMQHSRAEPDMITCAKSIAGGLPLSAVVGRQEVMDAVPAGGLGGTYGGNPVACACALAVVEVIEEENLLEKSMEIGALVRERLEQLARQPRYGAIGQVRALGAMAAFEIMRAGRPQAADGEMARAISRAAFQRGLILLTCGVYGNVNRILVPLTASEEIVREGLSKIEAAFEAVVTQSS